MCMVKTPKAPKTEKPKTLYSLRDGASNPGGDGAGRANPLRADLNRRGTGLVIPM